MYNYLYFVFLTVCALFVPFLGMHDLKNLKVGIFLLGNLSVKRFSAERSEAVPVVSREVRACSTLSTTRPSEAKLYIFFESKV